MRKLILGTLSTGLLLTALAGCGEKESANVKISNGVYVEDSNHHGEGDERYLALKVDVKNTSNEKLSISPQNFQLKLKDKTLAPQDLYIDDMKTLNYSDLGKEASENGYLFFKVKKGENYELVFKPQSADDEDNEKLKETVVKVETSDYKDPGQEAKNAAKQFVNAVFFNNKKDIEKNNLANNLEEENKNYKTLFIDGLKSFLGDGVSQKQKEKIFDIYQKDGEKRDKISYKVLKSDENSATIEVVAETVNIEDFTNDEELQDKLKNDFLKKHKKDIKKMDYNDLVVKINQYASDVLPKYIENAEVSTKDSDGYRLTLKKKDEKWEIVTKGSDSYGYTNLVNQFLGGVNRAK